MLLNKGNNRRWLWPRLWSRMFRGFDGPSALAVAQLRRILLMLLGAAAFAALLLYWRQQASSTAASWTATLPRSGYLGFAVRNSTPRWNWHCVENSYCVRSTAPSDAEPSALQSLNTCNMMCGPMQLWPHPTGSVALGSRSSIVTIGVFRLEIVQGSENVRDLIYEAFRLFKKDLASVIGNRKSSPAETSILVRVSVDPAADKYLRLTTDESYTLKLAPHAGELIVDIEARSFYGSRHALETLSQLVWFDPYAGEGSLRILRAAEITDSPKFPYRGLMLDTSRNFFPIPDILRTIDGMSASKLNTFHWHITDSQSFPFDAPSESRFARTGAYSPGEVYTADDIRHVVRHARVRGVRVLLEVDAPAHSGAGWTWGPEAGYGELALCTDARSDWRSYCGEPPCGQLNPRNPRVYDLLEGLYRDILDLTEVRDIFHLGGDEVNLPCWASNFNTSDPMDIWSEFTDRAMGRLRKAAGGKLPSVVLLWSSELTKTPRLFKLNRTEVAVQIWGGSDWDDSLMPIREGYRVLLSHVDAWYLDCGFGSWFSDGPSPCGEYRSWQRVYSHRPWARTDSSSSMLGVGSSSNGARGVLGAEVCQWSEQLEAPGLDARVWPRASAFAERLWSDPVSDDILSLPSLIRPQRDVYSRIQTHRERLAARGLRPAALWPRWCTDNPGFCMSPD